MALDTSFLLIGELAAKANTTKDTVRHYEQLGLLKSRKRQAGSRLYTEFHPECIERIELIKSAQAIGFTLTEIKNSLNDYYDGHLDIDSQLVLTQQKLEQVKKQQANISIMVELLSERLDILGRMKADSDYQLDVEVCKKKIPLQ
ncbi:MULTISPECIES: MerR family transcriptional regulator [Psychrobacter]|jgi:DNA-binding transcriptional MerR regulator|uniref:Transcriptional regulator, MerR family n=1 Tax=Psychrobacter nivimaris TaxID=281738 RepID=A0A6N7BXW9_9GAMM|nr:MULTISPECIES: MerR family transcriptional regulator [Psychrobacter]KAF0567876.1 Transcriptional regulator, MerR family [Psychrobacter nivimaris]MBA6243484.1 MerR family transcriptional regulator [Psychrobacter sp. Urea-trap-18]MBA6286090.1 MerR family transcriptional regulator [Psychrobacter sp. Urea-trap-16]MBA6317267.1 MerR family transcriptional regulator [Psychrobacter sp. Urea-trap-20]MBA6333413.1 MerR family transcriptional regulator [Psychrobacter sp. Urea-trap-19]|tara:strand:+ start:34838 stop:35272 length:435 start_codon:yes stop_codon:yes gene_type:complete